MNLHTESVLKLDKRPKEPGNSDLANSRPTQKVRISEDEENPSRPVSKPIPYCDPDEDRWLDDQERDEKWEAEKEAIRDRVRKVEMNGQIKS